MPSSALAYGVHSKREKGRLQHLFFDSPRNVVDHMPYLLPCCNAPQHSPAGPINQVVSEKLVIVATDIIKAYRCIIIIFVKVRRLPEHMSDNKSSGLIWPLKIDNIQLSSEKTCRLHNSTHHRIPWQQRNRLG